MRILWVSQHRPLPIQLATLRAFCGERVVIDRLSRQIKNAEEIVDEYRHGRYDDLVVVAPYSVIARLIDLGVRPLWADMREVDPQSLEADLVYHNRGYRFVRFRRIKMVRLEFDELGPAAERRCGR